MPRAYLTISFCALALAGCVAQDEEVVVAAAAAPLDAPNALECEWPSSLWGVCSTVLIHPRVAIAAGHCWGGGVSRTMKFGERSDTPSIEVGAECHTVPVEDMTYCVLDTAVSVPFVPPAMGCELPGIGPAQMAGYGDSNFGGTYSMWGQKRVAAMMVTSVSTTRFSVSGPPIRSNDSGSPIFIPAPDGTWRVLGIIIDSDFVSWGGGVLAAPQIAHIESATGIDVTPCTTANGTWAPGPDCRNFARTTSHGSGSWPSCTYDNTGTYSDSCGAPYAAIDAGVGVDAGAAVDASVGVDAGAAVDASVVVDAGVVADASTTLDAAASHDAGSVGDASVVVDGRSGTRAPARTGLVGGCACRVSARNASPSAAGSVGLLLLALWFAWRRLAR